MHDFTKLHDNVDVSLVDVDGLEGIQLAGAHDIMEYPAILVTSNEGLVLNIWTGTEMPLMNEVAGYLSS